MTQDEARAVDVVLDWIFSKPTRRGWDPARFKQACLLLAGATEKKGGRWSRKRIETQRW